MPITKKKCAQCGKEFHGGNRAKFCNEDGKSTCRVKFWRAKK